MPHSFPVPHNARLEKTLEPGQLVNIRGKFLDFDPKAEDFNTTLTINLAASGQGYDSPTIPFHISFRFGGPKEVVFNSKNNNEWGKEEKNKLLWKPGQEFDLRIRAHGDHFELMADHKDYAKYQHRIPITQISHIYVDGPISLEAVSWGGKYYSVPYESGIAGGFRPGKRLFVSGVIDKDCERFHINLLTSSGDIALHLNPRFKEKAIIRNTCVKTEWQNEEKEGEFPFKKDQAFDICIVNEEYSYQIFVNKERHSAYAHRVDPGSIAGLQVGGDIELQSVMVTD